jgi:hypothetical protein
MASFKKDKYEIIKKAIPKELSEFAYNYLLIKKQVAATMFYQGYIHKNQTEWGTFSDPQVPNTFSIYGDPAMETLLLKTQPIIEKSIKNKLLPTYSYARVYKKGDILKKHKDRESCEVSVTMNLGGDLWPIYLNPDPKEGYVYGEKKGKHKIQDYHPSQSNKKVKINLKPGDMLIYSGCELEHWREPFKGKECSQVFLHYNFFKNKKNIFDGRKHIGLPCDFKNV